VKQLNPDSFFYFIYIIPAVIIAGVFLFFFYKAIAGKGTQPIRRLTLCIAVVAVAAYLFLFITPALALSILDYLPLRLMDNIQTHPIIRFILRWAFTIFFAVIIVILSLKNNDPFIKWVWIVFLVFNLPEVLINLYLFFTWVKPVLIEKPVTSEQIILNHFNDFNRERYLLQMLYPLFWAVSSFVIIKKSRQSKKLIPNFNL
jgi:hypothetical protein